MTLTLTLARQQTRDAHAQRVIDVGGVCQAYRRDAINWRQAVFLLERIGLAKDAAVRLLELVR